MNPRRYWQIIILLSVCLSFILAFLLTQIFIKESREYLAASRTSNASFLALQAQNKRTFYDSQGQSLIPTGLYIESLAFINATSFHVSGYLWQTYKCDGEAVKPKAQLNAQIADTQCSNDHISIPKQGVPGFSFPEVDSIERHFLSKEAHRTLDEVNNTLTIVWYFETSLRQQIDNFLFPFGHELLPIKVWPSPYKQNVMLTPDATAYNPTAQRTAIMGINDDMKISNWQVIDAYFNMSTQVAEYTTVLNVQNAPAPHPQLQFNILLERSFWPAFLRYLAPVIFVAIVLFASLLTITRNKQVNGNKPFTPNMPIIVCCVLGFISIITHIHLRDFLSGLGMFYVDYIYCVLYVLLVSAGINAYLFSVNSTIARGLLLKHDNLVAKLLYWPALLLSFIAITVALF